MDTDEYNCDAESESAAVIVQLIPTEIRNTKTIVQDSEDTDHSYAISYGKPKTSISMQSNDSQRNQRVRKNYVCESCDNIEFTLADFLKHVQLHHPKPNNDKINYDLCHKALNSKTNMNRHMQSHEGERPHKCDMCKKSFSTKRNLVGHIQSHTIYCNTYVCQLCDLSFIQMSHLNVHMATHTGGQLETCPICQKKFSEKNSLRQHMVVHKEKTELKCPISLCAETFILTSDLEKHLYNHPKINLDESSCGMCKKMLYDKRTMLKQIELIHGGKLTCNGCQSVFNEYDAFEKHILVCNIKVTIPVCTVCQKTIVGGATSMKSHMLIHENLRSHSCNICLKTFNMKKYLDKHIRRHADHSSFQCKSCNLSFIRKSQLEVHMISHTGKEMNMCDVCGKSFPLKSALKRHEKTHLNSQNIPYTCQTCQKSYKLKVDLKKHKCGKK